jgi:tRNA pseudouridine55 synthase
MDGIFNVDKPAGMTSHDVVAHLRRLLRIGNSRTGLNPQSASSWPSANSGPLAVARNPQSKVGHAGTLDPMATGVLPIVVGKATRLVEYLADADKAYRATLFLGATSDTYDREGVITHTPDATMPTREIVETALKAFRGDIEQLPPMHSAIKVGGQKLYELARTGVEIERQPRHVTITRLDLEEYAPPTLQLFVECSKGTYIRSLAHDLGTMLGTGAYLAALQRTRHGPFTLDGAITLEGLKAAFEEGAWQESLFPPDYILVDWQEHVATEEEAREILQGKPLRLPAPTNGERRMMAVRTQDGKLLAVVYWEAEKEFWQPKKVLASESTLSTA